MQIYLDPVMVADQRSFVHATATMYVMAGYENTIFGYAIDAFKWRKEIFSGDPRLILVVQGIRYRPTSHVDGPRAREQNLEI